MAKAARGLTVSQRANGSWRAQIRKQGFPYESRDFLTHAEADAWGLGRLAEIGATGRLIDRRPAERTTFAATIERYIAEVTSKRPNPTSRASEKARLERFMRDETKLCSYAIAHLTPEIFEAWRDRRLQQSPSRGLEGGRGRYKPQLVPAGRLRKDGQPRKNAAPIKVAQKPVGTIAAGTVKREMTVLKRVLDFAMRRYKLATNPLDKTLVDRPAVQDERDVRIGDAEWVRLLEECRAYGNVWVAPLVELAVETGVRRGSLLKLRWEDVRLELRTLVLTGVKNSRAPSEVRTVEVGLSPRAVEILKELPRSADGRVFQITKSALETAFKRVRARAELTHFRLHDARHEMASRLVEADWDILDVMAQGDWRDPKSVKRYYTARGTHLGAKLARLPPRGNGES